MIGLVEERQNAGRISSVYFPSPIGPFSSTCAHRGCSTPLAAGGQSAMDVLGAEERFVAPSAASFITPSPLPHSHSHSPTPGMGLEIGPFLTPKRDRFPPAIVVVRPAISRA